MAYYVLTQPATESILELCVAEFETMTFSQFTPGAKMQPLPIATVPLINTPR